MFQNISLQCRDFYTLKGRIGRLDFILGLLIVGTLVSVIYYLLKTHAMETQNINFYFRAKAVAQLLALLSTTPFYVKRFHDLNSSGYWSIFFWLVLPFSFEGAYLSQTYFNILINPFNEFFLFLELIGFLIILVLLFKSGNPEANKWGSPNKRMQSDAAEPRR
jgi:uncharacterized membrane protein YhaH (DUF805 family)